MSAQDRDAATDPGYTLIPARWWWPWGRKVQLWHRMPTGSSSSRGWLVTEEVVAEAERRMSAR